VTITAPDSYAGGETVPITVTISDSTARRWGFQLSARTGGGQQAGTLLNSSNFTQIATQSGIQYIEHTSAGTRSGAQGPVSFNFQWRAPDVSTGTVTFYVAANAANNNGNDDFGDHFYKSSRTVQPQASGPTPSLSQNGVVNSASFAAGTNPLPPRTIAFISGSNLNDGSFAVGTTFDGDGRLLTSLGGASVTFNGTAAPMYFSSPTLLMVQIPEEVAGSTSASTVVTVNGRASAPQNVPIGASLPGIFTLQPGGVGQAIALIAGTATLAAPAGPAARPARRGESITIFSTGLGAVTNPPGTGRRASSSPLSATIETPLVTVGGAAATVISSGLTPGFVGLYGVLAQIPEGAPTGNAVSLTLTIGGVQSNSATIAVEGSVPASSAPTVVALSPSSISLDSPERTLTIFGTGFTPACTVTLNGVAKTASYVSPTQMTILVTPADLVIEGSYPVVVTNPAPGGGSSNTFMLSVVPPRPDDPYDDYGY